MILFFDAVSTNGYIGLYDNEKNYISHDGFQISGNESSQTTNIISGFLEKNKLSYTDISNIVTVVGPGSFTGVRTISLVVNTLAYSFENIFLTPVLFFDLFHEYPIVKSSSKRDLFVKEEKSDTINILSNAEFEDRIMENQSVFGDTNLDRFEKKLEIKSEIDYSFILKNINLSEKKKLAPAYIKKPNIS